VVMLDRDLSKTLNDINVRLDMITFGAKEKKITTVYRNESEVLNRLDSTEKRLEDRLKKMEKKLEEYNAELEFKMKRTNRQFDKQISDVIKSEVQLTDKINRLEEMINSGVPDADQKKMLQTSDRRFTLVENQLNQIEKNFSIFKNLLEAKYNQRLEQAEQKYVRMRETLKEDVNHLKEQFIDSVKRTEFKNFEIEEEISNKLDEIRKLISEKK
jgi:DNA repair exonuclease SbcCD ATPase subunit